MLDKFITLAEVVPSVDSEKRRVLRDHTEYLRNHKDTRIVPIEPEFAWPEIHNFYAYCKLIELDPIQIYPVMLLNRIDEPLQFTADKYQTLIIPSAIAVSEVLNTIL